MLRFLSLSLLLSLASCDTLDPFNADRDSFSATVRGDQSFDLEGSGYYSIVRDNPLTTSILLTDTDEPAIEFTFDGGSVRGTVYEIPDDATATFELDRYTGTPYRASGGRVEITRVTETRAQGEFSFTATRSGETVTVRGMFVAIRDAE